METKTLRLADVDENLHNQFKAACYFQGVTLKEAVLEFMKDYIAKTEKLRKQGVNKNEDKKGHSKRH